MSFFDKMFGGSGGSTPEVPPVVPPVVPGTPDVPVNGTDGNDYELIRQGGGYNLGAGDDTYVLSPAMIGANEKITIADTQGADKVELVGGLKIASSEVTANGVTLTLDNGATVEIFGKDYTFVVGGFEAAGVEGTEQTFDEFVTETLKTTVPAEGAAPSKGGEVTISGGTGGEVQDGVLGKLQALDEAKAAKEAFETKLDPALDADEDGTVTVDEINTALEAMKTDLGITDVKANATTIEGEYLAKLGELTKAVGTAEAKVKTDQGALDTAKTNLDTALNTPTLQADYAKYSALKGEQAELTAKQSDALTAYNKAVLDAGGKQADMIDDPAKIDVSNGKIGGQVFVKEDGGKLVLADGQTSTPALEAALKAANDLNMVVADLETLDTNLKTYIDITGTSGSLWTQKTQIEAYEKAVTDLQTAEKALVDAKDAIPALKDAKAEFDELKDDVDALGDLVQAVEDAEAALADDTIKITASAAATDGDDVFLLDETLSQAVINNFGKAGHDAIFVGADKYEIYTAEKGATIKDKLGDLSKTEAIVVDDGKDTTIYFEKETFAGNMKDGSETIEVKLAGVTGVDVAIDADGFLTIA